MACVCGVPLSTLGVTIGLVLGRGRDDGPWSAYAGTVAYELGREGCVDLRRRRTACRRTPYREPRIMRARTPYGALSSCRDVNPLGRSVHFTTVAQWLGDLLDADLHSKLAAWLPNAQHWMALAMMSMYERAAVTGRHTHLHPSNDVVWCSRRELEARPAVNCKVQIA